MKYIVLIATIISFTSCSVQRPLSDDGAYRSYQTDTLITQSLFNDRSATISEESIQKILTGNFQLPQQLRVALVKLESPQVKRSYWYQYDEDYLKMQQSYLDSFAAALRQSPRVHQLSVIPELLISKTPSFTSLRETAVRMQADVVVVFGIASDIYSKYRAFGRSDLKAFATTQLIVMDVRTGLVPFSTIVTKDFLSHKQKEETGYAEAETRTKHQAVLLTINEIGQQITRFLNRNQRN
jgi:hypothetical protein